MINNVVIVSGEPQRDSAIYIYGTGASQGALMVKNPHANVGEVRDMGSTPAQGSISDTGIHSPPNPAPV